MENELIRIKQLNIIKSYLNVSDEDFKARFEFDKINYIKHNVNDSIKLNKMRHDFEITISYVLQIVELLFKNNIIITGGEALAYHTICIDSIVDNRSIHINEFNKKYLIMMIHSDGTIDYRLQLPNTQWECKVYNFENNKTIPQDIINYFND